MKLENYDLYAEVHQNPNNSKSSTIKVYALGPYNKIKIIEHCVQQSAACVADALEKMQRKPEEFYTWMNQMPNLFNGVGFSEIVPGFEPFLKNEYTEKLKKDFPILMCKFSNSEQ
jgi:hypothetical protein